MACFYVSLTGASGPEAACAFDPARGMKNSVTRSVVRCHYSRTCCGIGLDVVDRC